MSLSAVVQLAPGLLECTGKDVALQTMRLRQIAFNVGVRATIDARGPQIVLAYLPRQRGVARLNGALWLNQRLAVIRDTAEFCSERACLLRIVEFDAQRVPIFNAGIRAQVAGSQWLGVLQARDPVALRLQARLSEAFEEPGSAETLPPAVERRLIASIGLAIESALAPKNRVNGNEHGHAMALAAERYMWSHIDDDIGLNEICRGISCHRRTLLNYFNRLYGMSPIRFLKILRLNRAQQALRAGDPRRITIFDVAADHGFWHMGHFSSAYRYLFGETPSETLHQVSY